MVSTSMKVLDDSSYCSSGCDRRLLRKNVAELGRSDCKDSDDTTKMENYLDAALVSTGIGEPDTDSEVEVTRWATILFGSSMVHINLTNCRHSSD